MRRLFIEVGAGPLRPASDVIARRRDSTCRTLIKSEGRGRGEEGYGCGGWDGMGRGVAGGYSLGRG